MIKKLLRENRFVHSKQGQNLRETEQTSGDDSETREKVNTKHRLRPD